jgi:hypothetical protein
VGSGTEARARERLVAGFVVGFRVALEGFATVVFGVAVPLGVVRAEVFSAGAPFFAALDFVVFVSAAAPDAAFVVFRARGARAFSSAIAASFRRGRGRRTPSSAVPASSGKPTDRTDLYDGGAPE